jgi:uncharacterized Zn-binding protein involved in type VI secretion
MSMALLKTVHTNNTTFWNKHPNPDAAATFTWDADYSSDVFINGFNCVKDQTISSHVHGSPPVKQKVTSTSTSVKANGKFIVRLGDYLECNEVYINSGSPTVFAG